VTDEPLELGKLRASLAARMKVLHSASERTAGDRRSVELDQASVGRLSRMDAMQVQAMAQAVERRRSHEIERIKATLRRIDDGDFGYCMICGKEISPKRLAIDSTTATCIDCASGINP
jgi:DnaK suppressor protein